MGEFDEQTIRREWLRCTNSCAYFIHNYCHIYEATLGAWIPFKLWPEQLRALNLIVNNRLLVILKARQLGLTWLVLCFILWLEIFKPITTALIFSRRETEAIYLLSSERLRGVYKRLPGWMRVRTVIANASHEWALSNGSVTYGFPTTAGDSYTASVAFVDEADLVPDLDRLLNAVKPTIDGGGRMVLLSRSDKTNPNSAFKQTFRGAPANGWTPIFLSWTARPGRDSNWYEAQRLDIVSRTGGTDDLLQQYPATAEEALRPPELDRRIPYQWLLKCYQPLPALTTEEIGARPNELSLPFLKIYVPIDKLRSYIISVDPAEGNPTSDDSAIHVLDAHSCEEVATLANNIEPAVAAAYVAKLSNHYNKAGIMVERNNHGHAVLLALREVEGMESRLLHGWDDEIGWMTSARSKAVMYDALVDAIRDGKPIIHSAVTLGQLASVEGTTLKAPEGEHDDYSISFALAVAAALAKPVVNFTYSYIEKATLNDRKRRDNVLLRRFERGRAPTSEGNRYRS